MVFLGADDPLAEDNVIGRMLAAVGNDKYDLVTSRGLVFDPTSRRQYSPEIRGTRTALVRA